MEIITLGTNLAILPWWLQMVMSSIQRIVYKNIYVCFQNWKLDFHES